MSERNIVRVINRYGSDGSIALAARISYGAKHVESERVGPIIAGLIANKEGTPFEFASMWFYIRCSRLCHSQFLQYRHASRITRSTRRVDPIESEDTDLDKLPAGYEQTHIDYALTDELKIPREIARRILPMSILTEFYWLVNLRELMHFLDERLSNKAEFDKCFVRWFSVTGRELRLQKNLTQNEIRDIAKRMELEFAGAFPITYMAWRGSNA